MVVVVADTGPIRYLIQVGHLDLLPLLFGAVSIPTEVARELGDPSAPPGVKTWIHAPPAWLQVIEAMANNDPALSNLDSEERAAIALGVSLRADLLLIDERRGYTAAVNQGLTVTGTLGILDLAAKRKLINLQDAIDRLIRTNFRYRKEIIETLLAQHRDR